MVVVSLEVSIHNGRAAATGEVVNVFAGILTVGCCVTNRSVAKLQGQRRSVLPTCPNCYRCNRSHSGGCLEEQSVIYHLWSRGATQRPYSLLYLYVSRPCQEIEE